jgi:hypothetical protein
MILKLSLQLADSKYKNARGEVRFKQHQSCNSWCVHNQLFNTYYEVKLKKIPHIKY